MLNSIKRNIIYGKEFCGIEVSMTNNTPTYALTLLKKTKKELILKHQQSANKTDAIKKLLPNKQHVFLIINDHNILFKKITSSKKQPNQLLNLAFPNINISDFYYEISSNHNDLHFIAIARKQHIDSIVESFNKNSIFITNFSLGNNCVSEITSFMKHQNISTSNAIVSTSESIQEIELNDKLPFENYNINGFETSNEYLLSFCGALSSYLNSNNRKSNNTQRVENLKKEYIFSILFSKTLKFSLIILLISLLFNLFIFNHYYKIVEELKVTSQINQSNKSSLLRLNDILKDKQIIIDDILKSNASKSSYYLNDIVKIVPTSIVLKQLIFNPLLKKIKKDQPIFIDKQTIIIAGISSKSNLFTDWIESIENLEWIQDVEISNYSDLKNKKTEFSIKINLKNE